VLRQQAISQFLLHFSPRYSFRGELAIAYKYTLAGGYNFHIFACFAVALTIGTPVTSGHDLLRRWNRTRYYCIDDLYSGYGRTHSCTIDPPGPIFYYGGLYGEIRTRTKYNTTLVPCDRFSTSSAAAPNSKLAQRRFRSFVFGLTCIGGGFYPGCLKNSITPLAA
jgi:hypothetical protein